MGRRFRRFVSGAAAAVTAAAMVGTPVSAASAETARYIAANNRTLIEVGATPLRYAQGISKFYYGKSCTGYSSSETMYTDSTYTATVPRRDFDGNDLTTEVVQYSYTYDAAGNKTSYTTTDVYGSSTTAFIYDANGQLVKTQAVDEGDTPYVQNYAYTYNADGVLLQKTEVSGFEGDTATSMDTTVYTYSYDKYGRLSDIKYSSGDGEYAESGYDHFTYKNNRLVRIYGGGQGGDAEWHYDYHLTYDNAKRLASATDTGYPGELTTYQFAYNEDNSVAGLMMITMETDSKGNPLNTSSRIVTQYSFAY